MLQPKGDLQEALIGLPFLFTHSKFFTMKKMLFALVGSALLLTACSKENKLNKVLDGEWNVTEYDGQAVAAGVQTLKFTPDLSGIFESEKIALEN